jgi:hypothetical protein
MRSKNVIDLTVTQALYNKGEKKTANMIYAD